MDSLRKLAMWIRALRSFLAFAALAATALPCEAQRASNDRSARVAAAPRTAPRMPAARAEQRHHDGHRHHHHHHHAPRAYVAPRVIVIAPAVRYVATPVYVAVPQVYAVPPADYAPASPPPPPVSTPSPPGTWRGIAGPFLALDGASFVAGGVTYVLTGMRAWDATTAPGAAARARLQQLLDSGSVSVWRIAVDGYGRAMVRAIVNGTELANQLRAEGFAAG
jgi:hypothetical protein